MYAESLAGGETAEIHLNVFIFFSFFVPGSTKFLAHSGAFGLFQVQNDANDLMRPAFYTLTSVILKGHGNETDFLGFLQKLVLHRSLTLPFEPFRFWLRIRGDIRNRKTTNLCYSFSLKYSTKYKYIQPEHFFYEVQHELQHYMQAALKLFKSF